MRASTAQDVRRRLRPLVAELDQWGNVRLTETESDCVRRYAVTVSYQRDRTGPFTVPEPLVRFAADYRCFLVVEDRDDRTAVTLDDGTLEQHTMPDRARGHRALERAIADEFAVDPRTARRLAESFDSLAAIRRASRAELESVDGVDTQRASTVLHRHSPALTAALAGGRGAVAAVQDDEGVLRLPDELDTQSVSRAATD
ncbi:hypothetical protein [Halosegnis sp.]|uniref:hypothetical protein n=1 Tax=Halosegnis sp. TaxID=2864959 RepID=UPI0035D3FB01